MTKKFYRKLISSIVFSLGLFIFTIFSKFDLSIINRRVTTYILILSVLIAVLFLVLYKEDNDKIKLNKVLYTFIDYYVTVLMAFCAISLINLFVIFPKVNGISMEPTLHNQDSVIVYRNTKLDRFDIIVFYIDEDELNNIPESEDGNLWCKRVIGLPGDRVTYVLGDLYINDTYYEEDFLDDDFINDVVTVLPPSLNNVVIPDGYYLVLGDNRSRSTDSRIIGLVSEDLIIGEIKYLISDGIKKVR